MGAGADPLLGSVVGGRYRVKEKLGEGGMGSVYVAVQEPLGRDVALKVVKWQLASKPTLAERFRREAEALAKLSHPNVVTLYDFGVDETGLFLAMERLLGETLGERIRRVHAIEPAVTMRIARDIASGLAVAHQAGVVHRDLKPDNIMLVEAEGRGELAKILDFGIARAADDVERLTATGVAVGTPGYMAPELTLKGVTDDPRLDLYALGVIWFEMLTSRAVFDAGTPIELVMKHASEPPPKPSLAAPTRGISGDVDELVVRLLAKDPNDRPRSAKELIALIDRIRDPGGNLLLSPPPSSPDMTSSSSPALVAPAPAAGIVDPARSGPTRFQPFPPTMPTPGLGPLQATETSFDVPVPSPQQRRTLPIIATAAAVVAAVAAVVAAVAALTGPHAAPATPVPVTTSEPALPRIAPVAPIAPMGPGAPTAPTPAAPVDVAPTPTAPPVATAHAPELDDVRIKNTTSTTPKTPTTRKGGDATKAKRAKSSDAKSSDTKSNDAKSSDARANDAKSSDAKSNDATPKPGSAKTPDLVP